MQAVRGSCKRAWIRQRMSDGPDTPTVIFLVACREGA
jgi:hypothetical protein